MLETSIHPLLKDWQISAIPDLNPSSVLSAVWDSEGLIIQRAEEGGFDYLVTFPGRACFAIDLSGQRIFVGQGDGLDEQASENLLQDQIVPRLLSHLGHSLIHASAIALDDEATFLFLGLSGAGKSSLAASFVAAGATLLGDDAMIFEPAEEPIVSSVYPSLRLYPDSAESILCLDRERMPGADDGAKQRIDAERLLKGSRRVSAAFVIDDKPSIEVEISRLSKSEGCMALVKHSFWLDPTDLVRTQRKMTLSSRIADALPIYSISYPRRYDALESVQRSVRDCLQDMSVAALD